MMIGPKTRCCFVVALFLWAAVLAGCADESARACSSQQDCFSDERCVEERCVSDGVHQGEDASSQDEDAGTHTSDSAGVDSDAPGSDRDTSGSLDAEESDSGNDGEGHDDINEVETCEVDRFESSCEPDELEPNESWASTGLLQDGKGWCTDDDHFIDPMQYTARLCGADHDIHLIRVMSFRTNKCISNRTKITVTVDFEDVECAHELFDIYPFWNSGQDICETDNRVQCTWSDDDRRFEIIWALDDAEAADIKFAVESAEIDLQLDYDFSVKVESW